MTRPRVKICGCTSAADVALVAAAGADAFGVILAAQSPRRVPVEMLRALAESAPPRLERIAVVVDPSNDEAAAAAAAGFALQFSGDETPQRCHALAAGARYYKALHVAAGAEPTAAELAVMAARYPDATILVDSRVGDRLGGTGVAYDWALVGGLARERPLVVSGGLTPGNVGACVRAVRPVAVDVRGGVESADRINEEKVRAFVRAVSETDAET